MGMTITRINPNDARIKQLESKLTAEDLTGDNTSGKRSNYRTIRMFRG